MPLGIDFGTTRTVVACSDRGNYPLVSFINEAGDATEWFPSVVAEHRGEWRFGFEALHAPSPWTVCRSFKRWLSGADASIDRLVQVGSTKVTLLDLLTRYFAALRHHLLEHSNCPKAALSEASGLPAVVAVPANAPCTQRFLTMEAFRRAGFSVRALLNEPSAAGFEYTHRCRATVSAKRDHVVVYDLGGGTFDVSLVRMQGRHHEVVLARGANRLGGDDFDAILVDMVAANAGLHVAAPAAQELSPRPYALLSERCREAKEALTPQTRKITIDLEGIAEQPLAAAAVSKQITIAVADYYRACAPLIEHSLDLMRPLVEQLDRHSGAAEREDIAGIYVVGGGSMLPAVGRLLRERFGRLVHRSPYSFGATAIGLAIAANPESGFRLSDRFSRSFGVFREANDGREVAFDPIITPDTQLPPSGIPLRLKRTYRAAHNLGHFRFVECAAVDHDGTPRGEIVPFSETLFPYDRHLRQPHIDLSGVSIRRTGEGPTIEEEYTIDASGMVAVCVRDLSTGYSQAFCLEQTLAALPESRTS